MSKIVYVKPRSCGISELFHPGTIQMGDIITESSGCVWCDMGYRKLSYEIVGTPVYYHESGRGNVKCSYSSGGIERITPNDKAAGSNPATSTTFIPWQPEEEV